VTLPDNTTLPGTVDASIIGTPFKYIEVELMVALTVVLGLKKTELLSTINAPAVVLPVVMVSGIVAFAVCMFDTVTVDIVFLYTAAKSFLA
jgi:hypothetical protein